MATTTTTETQKINARMSACTCGCQGADSQHRASYKRTVRDIRWYDGEAIERHGYRLAIVGTAQLPGDVRGKCIVGYFSFQFTDGTWARSGQWQVLDYINNHAAEETAVRTWIREN